MTIPKHYRKADKLAKPVEPPVIEEWGLPVEQPDPPSGIWLVIIYGCIALGLCAAAFAGYNHWIG